MIDPEFLHTLKQIRSRLSGDITALVSGQSVYVSGQVVKISGQSVLSRISGESVRANIPDELQAGRTRISSASGGTTLSSGDVFSVDVRNFPGNHDMYIGKAGDVYSGVGYLLLGGESKKFPIKNLDRVGCFAEKSGEYICYKGGLT